ncbi:MAG: hypothetical protein Q9183_004023 [Haloplaca sp. 2 TL-2023]
MSSFDLPRKLEANTDCDNDPALVSLRQDSDLEKNKRFQHCDSGSTDRGWFGSVKNLVAILNATGRPYTAILWIVAAFVNFALVATLVCLVYRPQSLESRDVQIIRSTGSPQANSSGTPPEFHIKRAHDFFRISKNLTPIPCHSHNDYEQKVPLYDALNVGCTSLGADVWVKDGNLLVVHTQGSLDPSRSLESLYLDPLASILSKRNPHLKDKGAAPSDSWKGVYSADPKAALVLLIDVKKDSKKTLPVLLNQLAPRHEKGFLTHFDGTSTIQRPITIVASEETDHDAMLDMRNRHVFFDAPLEKLEKDHDAKAEGWLARTSA